MPANSYNSGKQVGKNASKKDTGLSHQEGYKQASQLKNLDIKEHKKPAKNLLDFLQIRKQECQMQRKQAARK